MLKLVSSLSLSETQLVPPIVKDYLNKVVFLKDFVSTWHQVDGIEKMIDSKKMPIEDRAVLVQHLLTQYKKAGIEPEHISKTYNNILSLGEANSFTITTGHQLSLFGGTLFMSYKILTAIKLAADLNDRFPNKKFIPILWLASEDHDFEEIKSTYLFGKTITWEKDAESKATGKLTLNDIALAIEQLSIALGSNQIAQNWQEKIDFAYQKSFNLADATIRFYHLLFHEFGLVILDPNSKELKAKFSHVMKSDILDQTTFNAQIVSDKILEQRYKLQINARPINFFYLDENSVRRMIKKHGDLYTLSEGEHTFTPEELKHEIETKPERFSPNVNLRPLYQETVLPNLAYVGGPGEVAYWLQLKSNFEAFHIQYPMVVLRFMNLVLGKGLKEKIEKLGLELSDILESEKIATQRLIEGVQPLNFQEKFETILNDMQVLVDAIRPMDTKISKEFLESKLKTKEFYKSKSTDIKRVLESNEQIQIDRMLKLRSRLFPNGVFQERIETLMQMELMFEEPLLAQIVEIIEPFSGELAICED